MVPASGKTPTLISGSANFACSSMTMISVPRTTSNPPPQAMPLTAEIIGLLRLRGWFRPPNPPTPQSSSDFSPAAAALRSQPGEKKRSPAPVMIATLRDASSRNDVKISFSRRLAARSMAFALGRSMVTSKTSPALTALTPFDMGYPCLNRIFETNHRVHRNDTLARGPHDHRVDIDFNQRCQVGRGVACHREDGVDQRRYIARRLAAVPCEQFRHREPAQGAADRRPAPRRQEAYAIRQQFRQDAPGTENQDLAELRIHDHTDQNLRNTVRGHLFDQESVR